MADFGALTKKLVADAIIRKIPGLNLKVSFNYFVSNGVYDAETDTMTPVYNTISDVVVVGVAPSFEEVTELDMVAADQKLLVPGVSLPAELTIGVDKVTIGGVQWNIKNVRGVPGGSLFSIYVCRT